MLAARNLLAIVDSTVRFYSDPVLCTVQERSNSNKPNFAVAPFKVTPVPAKGFAMLEYTLSETGSAWQFELRNSRGQSVLHQDIPSGSQRIQVQLTGLTDGVYFYQVLNNNSIANTGKLVIVY